MVEDLHRRHRRSTKHRRTSGQLNTMTFWDFVLKASPTLILAILAIIGLIVCLVPIALKIAGLSGTQIATLLKDLLDTFLYAVRGYQAENKVKGKTD